MKSKESDRRIYGNVKKKLLKKKSEREKKKSRIMEYAKLSVGIVSCMLEPSSLLHRL